MCQRLWNAESMQFLPSTLRTQAELSLHLQHKIKSHPEEKAAEPGVAAHTYRPSTWEERQEDQDFKVTLR